MDLYLGVSNKTKMMKLRNKCVRYRTKTTSN